MIVYKDGAWKPIEETTVSVMDHGFLYGVGLFETFRTYNGIPFLFHDHLARLREGLASVYIEWEASEEDLLELVQTALEKNNVRDAVIRLNVTAGISNWGLPTEHYTKPSLLVFTRPIAPLPVSKEAVFLKLPRNTPEGEFRLKSHHYLNNLLGKREISPGVDAEGIFLTQDGYVAEGLVSNIFWIKDNTLFTPSLTTGILNGVTRRFILHVSELAGFKVVEGSFGKDHLLESEEVFITNSTQELLRVDRIGEKVFQPSSTSQLKHLQALYKEATERQLLSHQQVKKVDARNGTFTLLST